MTAAVALMLTMMAADTPPRFYACGAASKNYVVGMALPPSGLFEWAAAGAPNAVFPARTTELALAVNAQWARIVKDPA